jgi:hypothetical protein
MSPDSSMQTIKRLDAPSFRARTRFCSKLALLGTTSGIRRFGKGIDRGREGPLIPSRSDASRKDRRQVGLRTVDPFVGTRSIVWRGHAAGWVVLKDKGDAGRRKKRCHINTPRIGCILAQAHMSVGQSPGPVRHLGASEPSASREPRRHTINFLRSRLQETTSRLKSDSSMQINKYIEAGKENTRSPGTTLGIEGSVLLLRCTAKT